MNIVETPPKILAPDLLGRFVAIVGDKNAITDCDAQAPYLTEPRDMFRGTSPVVLRPGGMPRKGIERTLGGTLAIADVAEDAPIAPGMLTSHYAPKAVLRLDADATQPGEALLAFGPAPAFSGPMFNLSPRGDLIEAAANLFSHLRALDASGATRIAVMKVPHDGLGEAINDRLKRAAAPKRSSE